ncbi:Signal transduction histidine kinase [Aneurinibacillus thermoaerophilus]|uniref:histidine kinase n=1 Tax=Aneurinibacillus thermoaerophilus TaxID=143495 RepID=A0A1G7XL97_ANETH|nr:ATP-binding protein [Aneurinibacillus thermoaerophilus]SDG84917.1 Signal transduction histidine kinase [Aneurinibacillus thermoaerophilus]
MLSIVREWFGINKSIFRKLLFSYMITMLLGLGALGLSMSVLAKNYIYDGTKEELLRKAKKVNLAIQNDPMPSDQTTAMLAFLDQTFDTRIWVFDRHGRIISTSTQDEVFIGKSVARSIVEQVMQGKDVVQDLKFEGLSKPMLSVVVPWGQKNEVFGGIVLHAPVEGIDETVGNMREMIVWATLFGILLSTAMVSYISWTISRPLKRIDEVALEIERGNYKQRVAVTTEDEIGDLARTINRMASTLEQVEVERVDFEQTRQDFLANVSHELRTPLTAMQGFLEALQDGLVTDETSRQKYYDVMYKETMHMSRLVNDLLELVRLEKQEVNLVKRPIDMNSFLNRLVFAFKEEAAKRNLDLRLEVVDPLPTIIADPYRVEQIFTNLIGNALKFTEQGHIKLAAREKADGIEVTVEDTGIGISQHDLDFIWERFFKVDRVRSRREAGTGLGLAIVKELVELHHGNIRVESKIGEGTRFVVWLPSEKKVG